MIDPHSPDWIDGYQTGMAEGMSGDFNADGSYKTDAKAVRVTVNVREPLAMALKHRAEHDGKTFTQVLQEAIALKLFADEARDQGDRLMIRKSDGSNREVEFTNV